MPARTVGPVRIVGAGLLGASVGLALRGLGVDVLLDDASPSALALAVDYGAGRTQDDTVPLLVVVAVPPDLVADVVERELERWPDALVTDTASVKAPPLARLVERGADVSRYVGSHPMAGRERSGPIAARADLFLGRPWVVSPHTGTAFDAFMVVENLAADTGAVPVRLEAGEHDLAVGLVSHAPHVVASLVAGRLVGAEPAHVSLAGGGLRDVTRIAASDATLWVQILTQNASAVAPVLRAVRDDLDRIVGALEAPTASGALRTVAETLAQGNAGVAAIPGKHGQDLAFASLVVLIDDTPGQLARLLTEVGELGVNLEDLRLEHSPGAPIGIVELQVQIDAAARLEADLIERGWRIAG